MNENEKSKILVRDTQTKQTLFECSLDEAEKAYHFASEMESVGLDLEIISPTLSQTLSASLGLSDQQQEDYQKSLIEEIDHHEGSCCVESPKGLTTKIDE